MPNTREKLIELLDALIQPGQQNTLGEIADYFIANGVTVQKWISVNDRLPPIKKMIGGEEYMKTVAIRVEGSEVEKIAYYDEDEKQWFGTDDFHIFEKVTYWYELPEWNLPQPPKGE